MSNYGLKISRAGYDVKTAADKDMIVHSKYNTLKIKKTGRLTVEAPSETLTISSGDDPISTNYKASYTHDLGYLPFYLPECNMVNVRDEDAGEIYVNDRRNETILWSYSPGYYTREYVQLYVTTTQIVLLVRRELNVCLFGTCNYEVDALTAYVDYTLFYNRVDTEFNVLSTA